MFSPKVWVLSTFVVCLFLIIWGGDLIMMIITPIMGAEKASQSWLPSLAYLLAAAWVIYFCIYLYFKMWGRDIFGRKKKKK